MGKRARSSSGGRGGRGGQTDTGRQLGKQDAHKNVARLNAQRSRLQRALAKADGAGAEDKTKQLLAVHEDAVETYRDFVDEARGGQDWVQTERLKHLKAIFQLAPDADSAIKLHADYVLTLLDEGEAAEARKVLETLDHTAQAKCKAVFAWSLALVELVAWKGEEEGASEEVCRAAVAQALKANVYIGIFLSNLDCYTREIDPTHALQNLPVSGRMGGSVEEALSYTALAAGCWMDFDDDGSVTQVVGHELENLDVPWPPSTEGKTDRYLKQFEAATAIAEREVDETDDDEQGGEEEEEGEGEEDEEEAEAEAESEAKVEAADGKGGGKKSKKS